MELLPLSPPGSAQRKLRGYLVEIGRLRNEGYTIAVILEALKARGVSTSYSAVQREVKRLISVRPAAVFKTVNRFVPQLSSTVLAQPNKLGQVTDVNAFFNSVNTNPLFKKRKL